MPFHLDYNKCIADCEAALAIDPNFAKAYHRKAKALVGLSTPALTQEGKWRPTAASRRS